MGALPKGSQFDSTLTPLVLTSVGTVAATAVPSFGIARDAVITRRRDHTKKILATCC